MNAMMCEEKKNCAGVLEKIAKVIRGVTVPPVMVAGLLLVLLFGADVFPTVGDFVLTLLFLAVVPVLAYPVSIALPQLRAGGQRMRRKLAFVFSIAGYLGAVVTAIARNAIPNLLYVTVVYLVSVLILTLINLLTPWHASGHACSLMGPLVLATLFIGWYAVSVTVPLYLASFWASIYMKRHTVSEFLLGSIASALSALLCCLVIHPVF